MEPYFVCFHFSQPVHDTIYSNTVAYFLDNFIVSYQWSHSIKIYAGMILLADDFSILNLLTRDEDILL